MRGELKIQKLTLQATDERSKKKSVVVRGIVNNATNRVQRAIMLKVSIVTQTGISLDSKRHACCGLTLKSGDDAQEASPQGGVREQTNPRGSSSRANRRIRGCFRRL